MQRQCSLHFMGLPLLFQISVPDTKCVNQSRLKSSLHLNLLHNKLVLQINLQQIHPC